MESPRQWQANPSRCPPCPDPSFRPVKQLGEAACQPGEYASFRAMRGFRPGDYFTRGTSLGGNTRPGGVASLAANIRAADGFAWSPSRCGYIPEISACSRFNQTLDTHSQPEPSAEEAEALFTDAFTMTDQHFRHQGTTADFETANKSVAAAIVKRDIATDTDDSFELQDYESAHRELLKKTMEHKEVDLHINEEKV